MTDDDEVLKRSLKKQFPSSDLVPRPVKVKVWDGRSRALRYPYKDRYERRISTDKGKRFDKKTGKERRCRATDKQPLLSKQRLELLLHLDGIGTAGRLFLRGVQFQSLTDIGPTFKDCPMKSRVRETGKRGS